MVLRLATTILVFGVWVNTTFAQIPSFIMKRYDDVPELSNTHINRIIPDSKGFCGLRRMLVCCGSTVLLLWPFGTLGDSTSLGYNHVYCLAEDKSANLSVGLPRGGVSMYDRKTGKFHNYSILKNQEPSTASVVGIFVDADRII